MSKRREPSDDAPPPHRPLSALQSLRDRLPTGPEPDPIPAATDPAGVQGPERLVVHRERKGHGGKTATRVQGLAVPAADRRALAKDVKRALGSGARWEADDLLIQGDLLERVAVWFEARGHRVVRGN
ncbi:MAG: translation initiation factor [Epsilonproteobacteria bacterium]|nr:MAG: translation initiation factor [Campylobacterota bacterium]